MDLRTPVAVTGIIPACAGNTIAKAKRGDLVGDHPRMRGEHLISCYRCLLLKGSSPHARGTQVISSQCSGMSLIIPACAGNTMVLGV